MQHITYVVLLGLCVLVIIVILARTPSRSHTVVGFCARNNTAPPVREHFFTGWAPPSKPPRIDPTMPNQADAAVLLDTIAAYIETVLSQLQYDIDRRAPFGNRAYFVRSIIANYSAKTLRENPPTNSDTAFVVNKGEDMALCLRNRITYTLIEPDLLRFVTLHELSHLGCVSNGHPDEFWNNFGWFLHYLQARHLYSPVNYAVMPQNYCSLIVRSNPYYDEYVPDAAMPPVVV